MSAEQLKELMEKQIKWMKINVVLAGGVLVADAVIIWAIFKAAGMI